MADQHEVVEGGAAAADAEGAGEGEGEGKGLRAGVDGGQGKLRGRGVVETRDPGGAAPPLFEHERMVVYQVAREFFVMSVPWKQRKIPSDLQKQFDRSTMSILWNIAEGAGKTARADKRRFYEIAKGSTTESAAQLEIIHLLGIISAPEYATARSLLIRVVRMLHALCGAPRTTQL